MSFKFRSCEFLFYLLLLLLWRIHGAHCYADGCEQPHPAVYCSCESTSKETTVTCFIFGNLSRTDTVWSSLSNVENAISLTLHSRLPTRLDYIPSESLKDMQDLQSLAVQEGNLGTLQAHAVSNLTNLRWLKLERNEITGLERNAICNLPKLKRLALSENLLNELMAESMMGLEELEQLFLDRNNISRIESCAFCDLQNLKELELWDNQLTDLTEYTFRGLRYLKRLDLYKNRIRILNDRIFHTMPRLLEIDLKDNLIEYIAPRAFRGLDSLQRLMLHQNRLKKLPNQIFKSLSNLRSVELSPNRLETLQVEVLQNMANAKDEHFAFSFRENPLKCDCHLHWVASYLNINKSHQFTRELQELKCLDDEDQYQYAKHLKLDCDKPKKQSPELAKAAATPAKEVTTPAKAKHRSSNETALLASSAENADDNAVDDFFGDSDYASGNGAMVQDSILMTLLFAFLGSCLGRT